MCVGFGIRPMVRRGCVPGLIEAGRPVGRSSPVIPGWLMRCQRPGNRCVISWSTQPLPSGSLKVAKEP